MSRVMLVCPEPLGHGQPAGIGIRFVEMANVLRDDGHQILLVSRDGGEVSGCSAAPMTPDVLRDGSAASDVMVVQGHAANDVFAHARRVPTVVDLYDPYIVENLHYFRERGAEVYAHDHATLIGSLLNGDVFLCASEAQRLFYLGALLTLGRLNPVAFENDPHLDRMLRIAPFGVRSPREHPPRDAENAAILFGGIYDWYDPILAIEAVAIARATIPRLTLTFTRHSNPDLTPQGKAAEAMKYVVDRGYEFVEFVPWVAYERRSDLFDRHAISLLTFPQSLETDLSMRTRVYDYLWGGMPIITSSAPGTDQILTRYDAGVIVRDHSAEAFAGAIVSTLGNRARYEAMLSGTRAFVEEHQWERTLAPLIAFCRDPRIDSSKDAFAAKPAMPQHAPSVLERIRRRIGGGS